MLWILSLLFLSWTPAVFSEKRFLFSSSDVCFGDLGCFSKNSPFGGTSERPVALLPETPDKIGTKFQLYTRSNPTTPYEMTYSAVISRAVGPFVASRPTKFIIHGFLDSERTTWFGQMKDALLNAGDMNVIIVNWTKGNGLPYTQATANTQVVGAQIAQLLKALLENAALRMSDVHLIGHSLGAHVAGYAGKRQKTIARITGLDPANPYFQYTDAVVRLDSTDAAFVDIIHTDAGASVTSLGFGLLQTIGHVDFFPNGGSEQPGCPAGAGDKVTETIMNLLQLDLSGAKESVKCSHSRAYELFTASIDPSNAFVAFPCGSKSDFNGGKCANCKGTACPRMGFYADATRSARGSFQLATAATSPFSRFHYFVTLKATMTSAGYGSLDVKLNGDGGSSDTVAFFSNHGAIVLSGSYSVVVTSPVALGTIRSATLQYTRHGIGFSSFGIDSVTTVSGEQQTQHRFCANGNSVSSGTNTLNAC